MPTGPRTMTGSCSRRWPIRASVGRHAVRNTLDLTSLEARLDQLIAAMQELDEENRALREQQANLMAERAALIEKSELARSRVESMIARLKAMEISP